MALIKCPICGREVVLEDTANCPICKYPILKKHGIANEQSQFINDKNHQQKTIDNLNSKIESCKKTICITGVVFGICIIPLLCLFEGVEVNGGLLFISILAGFISGVILILGFPSLSQLRNDLYIAQKSIDDYNTMLQKREKEEEIRAAMIAENLKCPICGSSETKRISSINRAASIATVGLASSKIGKQYQCRSCNHKW